MELEDEADTMKVAGKDNFPGSDKSKRIDAERDVPAVSVS